MNKEQIQQRVLKGGKPLDLDKFSWDEKTRTFSSRESNLVLDFRGNDYVNLISGHNSIQAAGDNANQTARHYVTQTAGDNATQKAWDNAIQKAWDNAIQRAWDNANQTAKDFAIQKARDYSNQTAGDNSIQTAGNCSTHTVGNNSQVITGYSSIIHVKGDNVVIINLNVFEVILPKKGDIIQICPCNIAGHLVNGKLNGIPHIIADGILSEVISKKGAVYKVKNRRKEKISYLIEKEINGKKVYSHGATIKEAKDSLIYKLADRDKSKWENLNLDSVLNKNEAIECYMTITGACEEGTRYFVESQENLKQEMSVEEIIEFTRGQFGNSEFEQFFNQN